jgi:class 3 adenylate cyclase
VALEARCPSCGKLNLPDAQFCAECGQKLSVLKQEAPAKAATIATASPTSRTEGAAERRQLTVMFVDLVGSTALSARLDPEDMREIIGTYHRSCAEQITKAGGFVAKYMGDGVLAYFGYPQAHEDGAERAVHAALALTEAVSKLRIEHDATLQVRVGIATGLVVVGDLIGEGVAQEQGVVGETPNVAARLQALSEPGQVVISDGTRRLTGGMFEYSDLGKAALKGLAGPVQAWGVIGTSAVQSRFEAHHGASLTPLVGRAEELELLLRRWERAKRGEGQVVLLSGEPGIGKSRLTVALQERLQKETHTHLRYFCSPQHTDSAFYPVIAQLERAASFERSDISGIKLDKLVSLLGSSSKYERDIELLAELLSIPTGDRYAPLDLSPQRKKEKTFDTLLRQLDLLSRQRPVLMVYEDVHWVDPSSRELLDMTVERVASLPVLVVVTFRPEFQPPWVHQPHVTVLNLTRLASRDRAALVGLVAKDASLSEEITAQIVDRTDGVPLFVEELTKAVIEAGIHRAGARVPFSAASKATLGVPATLYASLMARLDRLGGLAKEIAQIAAAIGRDVRYELLLATSRKSDNELKETLSRLVSAGLVLCRGTPPKATLMFKHALVRDAAYDSLLRHQRRDIHLRIAKEIERNDADTVLVQPETLAFHFQEAGDRAAALRYWSAAGNLATSRSASREASTHYRAALSLLPHLPEGYDRLELEFDLSMKLANALMQSEGYTSWQSRQSFVRAREVALQLGHVDQYIRACSEMGSTLFAEAQFSDVMATFSRVSDPDMENAGVNSL